MVMMRCTLHKKKERGIIMSLKIGRNDPCWCGSGKKYKKCHEAFDEKMEIMKQKGNVLPGLAMLKEI